ncbi:MAG: trehalose-phosphatase [Oligoflexia bacterium]|nr:trehalose-phosphatase [Oligoflexia bacterium]MBF0364492.1 trehalose-phosphatase [Oligoflexia bacterium]
MKYLFNHLQTWFPQMPQKKILFAFDLDGTLAPIVNKPERAKIPNSTRKLLELLSTQKQGNLLILTGRSNSSAKKIIGNLPCHLIGNHGLEADFIHKNLKQRWIDRCRKIINELNDILPVDDYFIEDKKYSISIHDKDKTNHKQFKKKILTILAPILTSKDRIILGKNVINIMPTDKIDKGTTLMTVKRLYKSDFVIFAGDDCTDEDVFKINKSNVITVKIGLKRNSCARFYLKEQKEINRFLKTLIMQSS